MAKLKKFKAKPSSVDIGLIRQKAQELNKNRREVIDQKFEEKKTYYTNKLAEMVDATLSSIDKETTPQQLADMLKIGDKEWKSLCATGRKTNTDEEAECERVIQLYLPRHYLNTIYYQVKMKPGVLDPISEIVK